MEIKLATTVGHFLCDLDFANVSMACPTCWGFFVRGRRSLYTKQPVKCYTHATQSLPFCKTCTFCTIHVSQARLLLELLNINKPVLNSQVRQFLKYHSASALRN